MDPAAAGAAACAAAGAAVGCCGGWLLHAARGAARACGGCGEALTTLPADFARQGSSEGACDGCGAAFPLSTANDKGYLHCLACDVSVCAACRRRGVVVAPRPPPPPLTAASAEHVLQQLNPLVSDKLARRLGPRAGQVYVAPVLSPAECTALIDAADRHAAREGWGSRHRNYSTQDLAVRAIPGGADIFDALWRKRIGPFLSRCFGVPLPELAPDDVFVVKYDCDGGQRSLGEHQDGSVVSFNVLLSDTADFGGGGTRFACIPDAGAVRPARGECLAHLGALQHSGEAITAGRRYILVGFCSMRTPYTEQLQKQLQHCANIIEEIARATDRMAEMKGCVVRDNGAAD